MMNEQIKALIGQTLDEKFAGTWSTMDMQDLQKFAERFAELIVRECARVFESEVDTWKQMDPYQGSIKRKGTKAIREHFGVEK